MKVELLYHTPLWVCSQAIRTCWDSHSKSDTKFKNNKSGYYDECMIGTLDDEDLFHYAEAGKRDKELIERIGNKNKHSSTLEHLVYTFEIKGISRACLQELARHRIASLSVKSTRYTLKELKNAPLPYIYQEYESYEDLYFAFDNKNITKSKGFKFASKYLVWTGNKFVDTYSFIALRQVMQALKEGISNDIVKYALPEAYKTELTWTINARSLQNFIQLRSSKAALWEIRELAKEIYETIPEEHKYLFKEFINE